MFSLPIVLTKHEKKQLIVIIIVSFLTSSFSFFLSFFRFCANYQAACLYMRVWAENADGNNVSILLFDLQIECCPPISDVALNSDFGGEWDAP